jgi:hypothetical protein
MKLAGPSLDNDRFLRFDALDEQQRQLAQEKQRMTRVPTVVVCSALFTALAAHEAWGHAKFRTAFTKKYVTDHPNAEFQSVAKKEGCNICHLKGLKKSHQNQYGKELNKLIEGSADERYKTARKEGGTAAMNAEWDKLLAELEQAFTKVSELKSPTGETFGERIKAGQLPVDPEKAAELAAKIKEEEERQAAGQ